MHKICIVGSGNWGSTVAKVIAENVVRNPKNSNFDKTVRMYVYDEIVDGQSIIDIINTKHENVKYLPGIKLPENVLAMGDLGEAATGCDYFVFVTPHQYLNGLLKQMKGKAAPGATGINLIKGVCLENAKIELIPDLIEKELGFPCGGLTGANIAKNVALEQFSEATIAFTDKSLGQRWKPLFNSKYFKCKVIDDLCLQQLCGTLKNVIALGGGFIDGLGYGENTKAAILRIGLEEMVNFAKWYFPNRNCQYQTLLESCGVADLIATSYAGRNHLCAIEFVKTGKDWDVIEKEMLNGQKLQGTIAAAEIYKLLEAHNATDKFPLMSTIYLISVRKLDPIAIIDINNKE